VAQRRRARGLTARRARALLAAAALSFPALAAAGVSTTPASKTPVNPGSYAAGRKLFIAQACGSCHIMAAANQMDGSGLGPDLDRLNKTYAQIVTWITVGGHGMSPFKHVLTTLQIEDLANFIWTTGHPK
jgi:mono/diheme cytochrome c family protein